MYSKMNPSLFFIQFLLQVGQKKSEVWVTNFSQETWPNVPLQRTMAIHSPPPWLRWRRSMDLQNIVSRCLQCQSNNSISVSWAYQSLNLQKKVILEKSCWTTTTTPAILHLDSKMKDLLIRDNISSPITKWLYNHERHTRYYIWEEFWEFNRCSAVTRTCFFFLNSCWMGLGPWVWLIWSPVLA